jgi:hypothetical protein
MADYDAFISYSHAKDKPIAAACGATAWHQAFSIAWLSLTG